MEINNYDKYLENQLTTATPGRLVVMTFDAAIKFARAAAQKIQEHKLDEQSACIRKAQSILLELITCLNAKSDPLLASNLYSLYTYLFDRLTYANLKDDEAAVSEVINVLTDLRQIWHEAETLVRSDGQVRIGSLAGQVQVAV